MFFSYCNYIIYVYLCLYFGVVNAALWPAQVSGEGVAGAPAADKNIWNSPPCIVFLHNNN